MPCPDGLYALLVTLLPLVLILAACSDISLRAERPTTETDCSDGADDDLDGAFDCADADCFGDPACPALAAPGVGIEPAEPTSAEDLLCTVEDPDASVVYAFTWLRDGASTGVSSPQLSATATSRDEIWSCAVTPTAQGVTGETGLAEVQVANATPSGAGAAISPESPRAGLDSLLCAVATPAVDADGDAVGYRVEWTVDGSSYAGSTRTWPGDSVPGDVLAAEETWSCALLPGDGIGEGEAARASVVVGTCDADGDGHLDASCGGGDCDDGDAAVNPGAAEVCDNGIDDDCDGSSNDCRLRGEYPKSDALAVRYGEKAGDYASTLIRGGHDLDGDGNEDFLVGGYAFDGVGSASGIAWVLYGPLSGSDSLANADARLLGEVSADFAGIALDVSPDFSGDGLPELVVGANGTEVGAADGGTVYFVSTPVLGDLDLEAADFRLDGTEDHARFGSDIDAIEDLDGAGTVGVLIGAYGHAIDGEPAGAAYLFAGPLAADGDDGDAIGSITGLDADRLGASNGTGDVDGDGISDYILGSDEHDGAASNAGAVFVIYGPVSGTVSADDADHLLLGESQYDNAGRGVEMVGDVNADGLADALVGARGVDIVGNGSRNGQAYLVLGPMADAGLYDAHAELRGETDGSRAGGQLARAGDVDNDGFDDMLVGCTESARTGEHAGAAYLIFGPVTGRVQLGDEGAAFRGETGDYLGSALGASDHDGDGDGDVLIGAFYDDTNGEAAGAVWLFEGTGL